MRSPGTLGLEREEVAGWDSVEAAEGDTGVVVGSCNGAVGGRGCMLDFRMKGCCRLADHIQEQNPPSLMLTPRLLMTEPLPAPVPLHCHSHLLFPPGHFVPDLAPGNSLVLDLQLQHLAIGQLCSLSLASCP